MIDPRVEKLAKLLVHYSLGLEKGQFVSIRAHAVAAPLVQACYRAALRAGANPEVDISIEGLTEIFYKEASEAQLAFVSPVARLMVRRADALLAIMGGTNTRALTNVDPKRLAIAAKAHRPLNKVFLDRAAKKQLRWSGTAWPTSSGAQEAEMSLAEYEEFIFSAGHLDDADPIKTWRAISASQKALVAALNKTREIRIVAADTDITLGVRGRKWINCDGHENFPDGEVFTGPVETAVNGHIRFSFPAVHHAREVTNVFLEFSNGRCVKSTADKGEDYLRAMIAMDKGSCFLGELAFGANYNITKFTRNTLFDEKIGGTVHLALGNGYPETGNRNSSGLHWDMVCDLRKRGEVYADGKLIQRDGRFLDKRFPQPAKS
ncbi:MAG: aminopeptidase [Phycisphaerae bacterium]